MSFKTHWEGVYGEKAPEEVSWYRPHLEKSVQLIEGAVSNRSATIIDVGGGESTLVDDLLMLGYQHVSVLDISQKAIQVAQQRLGASANTVEWLQTVIYRMA